MVSATAISSKIDNEIQATFNTLHDELVQGLKLYWDTATQILDTSPIKVLDAGPSYFSLEKNFFSSMFLYSYFRGEISKSRRIFYVAVNQCLRGMVTGCDNILDDEYKMTLATDLPLDATKFRSVLDIMVSDRVLFSILQQQFLLNDLTSDQVLAASNESLRTLAKSGAQEASEEQGTGQILNPEYILSDIHSLKTGVLFQSPWALPDLLENPDEVDDNILKKREIIKGALFDIGIGCQIFDDMVDLSLDIKTNHHNYVASLIKHEGQKHETELFEKMLKNSSVIKTSEDLLFKFPVSRKKAAKKGLDLLVTGAENLFALDHQFMVEICISMISKRIGADRFLTDIER
ncbi:MAG: hypothetical protein GY699_19920 [Desulfobacteraceae bacterium]|nr:hypothetical protein [Desulfobacteraceae bacterium]